MSSKTPGMSDKERRKAELEEKRRRVQELRDRKAKGAVTPRVEPGAVSTPANAPKTNQGVESVENVLDSVSGLLENMSISAKQPEPAPAAPVEPVKIPQFFEKPPAELKSQTFNTVTIAPVASESYAKGCQTDAYEPEPNEEWEEDATSEAKPEGQAEAGAQEENVEETKEVVELTPAQAREVMAQPDFMDFISSSSRVMERALGQSSQLSDIMVDYTQVDDDAGKNRQMVSLHCQFDEPAVENRIVTDVAWHPTHGEAFYTAYSSKADGGPNDPDGTVLMWSLNMRQRPEYTFTCQSAVQCLVVSEFHPTVVMGGTYSGQIMLWDTRAKSTPVQRTQLSSLGHSHPVHAMKMVGTQNAHNLISVSTNGRMCSWEVNKMSSPKEYIELKTKPAGSKTTTKETDVNVTCLASPEAEFNNFFVGAEDGTVCDCTRHGAKPGVNERFEGHFGPVTGLDFHFGAGSKDFSDFFLTSSMDWTVRLWNKKKPGAALHSFENGSDYVYDVKWSPTHPAVFASVDGTGTLSVWNLNEDYEMPRAQVQMSPHAMNRLQWSADGTRIITGNTQGQVYVYDVASEVTQPNDGEWTRLADVISELS
eukprot:TRINITY_DN19462_c0_g1_i8.p1 TRINITY_DN19462_c0_g1~~TRINITY_DN19462_c0_g1_i8.p1  ORF type:complete len:594 (+),score=135.58 TRINITY_DN19462_c0_g1_i8:63-1844(+)